ncbi:DUF3656 domain-containing protein [Blautia coccoides]|uniref:U32 family peptidase n=1 Tax=Blautia producta TaxID=33035 RepID=UPI0028A40291|nr:DUF3656 domain-containing protein [Blautia coccoides]MDT4372625.1 DUF3656 domain-containing protein [Blautia coccoides]
MRAELLAPAGSYEGLRAAVTAGADAVYIGGKMFGARAYAKNPDADELLEAIDFTHLHGKKIYMTVNTLLKNRELEEQLYTYLAPYYERGVDGVIVQDYGVLSFIRREFPELPIHVSTQMAVTGANGAQLLKEAGASRIVTARELSLEEIHRIYQETGMEIESFIHGALCYCYSGMCLFSSMLGGRSGNRGRCAQPCRLPYEVYDGEKKLGGRKEEYPLSPKDMCTIDILPEILKAGVYSLKIEGRMKKPEYAAGVSRIYRKYLDLYEKDPKNYRVLECDRQELLKLYQRDGFNEGYYKQHNGRNMIAVQNLKARDNRENGPGRRDEELFSQLKVQYVDKKLQEKIYGNVILFCGSPAILDLEYGNIHKQVQGESVQPAQNQPLSAERVKKQMEKTGSTPFVFERLDVQTDEQGFLPMQSLNELRRKGLEELAKECLLPYRRALRGQSMNAAGRNKNVKPEKEKASKDFYVSVETWEQMEEALGRAEVDGIYCSISMFWGESFEEKTRYAVEYIKEFGKECYLAFPYIQREGILERKEAELVNLAGCLDGFLVRNLEELGYLKRLGLADKAVCDHSLYAFNDESKAFLEEQGVLRTTVPLEQNGGEIRRRDNENSEWIIYGNYPMMISAQCLKKTYNVCDKKGGFTRLKDRYGNFFAAQCECNFCYNVIYNSVPTGLLREAEQIKAASVSAVRMNFTIEGKAETGRLLDLFLDVYKKNKDVPGQVPEFTKGHFKRGVE